MRSFKYSIMSAAVLAGFVGVPFLAIADGMYTNTNQGYTNSGNGNPAPLDAKTMKEVNNAAFQQLLKTYFPLTPDQVHEFKDASALQKEANARPAGPAPAQSTSNIIPVDFKPGHIMPVIRISSGMVTSLVFTDKAGQVWPVTTYTLGDPASFDVQWDKKSGVLMVQGKQLYGQSNIGVMLQGMQVPVMVTLILGQKDWDYLDYIQVQQYMPSDQGIDHPSLSPAPAYLTSILNGVPPAGAVSLTVSGSDAKVWSFDGHYVMLTQSTLLSPAWSARADGPNNYHAYELPTTPVIMLSNNGQIQRVTISSGQSQTPSDDLSSQNAGGL